MATEYDSPKDFGPDPEGEVRRWLLELKLYDKNTRLWKTQANEVWKRYRGSTIHSGAEKNSFNILWANTEVLRQAIYQGAPGPDISRRFKDEDPVGKAVGEVLQRSLEFTADTGKFSDKIKKAVFDMILVGRGVLRLRYIPSFTQVGLEGYETEANEAQEDNSDDHEAFEEEGTEELAFERVALEHVLWKDFAHGPGDSWEELTWVGFRHDMYRDQLKEKFGKEIAYATTLEEPEFVQKTLDDEDPVKDLFRTVEVWEIWDKDTREVKFVSEGYKHGPLGSYDDPLGLEGFFPMPGPLYDIEDTASLRPIIPYMQYKEQGEQLNRLHTRIHKIIDALRVRGAYDPSVGELGNILKSEDNSFVAAENAAAYMSRGGLANAIWFFPIEQFAVVIQQLAVEADRCRQSIYEITGIADIMRGASNPNETATAQNLKSQWGNSRLSRLQSSVQAYIRSIYELSTEIICKCFSQETLAKMTGMKLPTLEEAKAQQQQAMQQAIPLFLQAAIQAKQQGQPMPPPPPPPSLPLNWEQVITVMQDDALRQYQIDVESDATAGAKEQAEMAALKDLILTISQALQQLMPLVQAQVLPLDAVKELLLAVVRRAKLGETVETAIEHVQQPPAQPQAPPGSPQQGTPAGGQAAAGMSGEQQMQVAMAKLQQQAALEQQKLQAKVQSDQVEVQAHAQTEMQIAALQAKLDAAIEQMKAELQAKLELLEHQMTLENQKQMVQVPPMPLLADAYREAQ